MSAHPEREVGGVLVGGLDATGALEIRGAIAALKAQGERSHVTFTHDAWAAVHRVLERDYPRQRIVGWYHSHPGFGIFLSKHDIFIHRHFFSAPHQIAFVVDPHTNAEGTFGWLNGRVQRLDESPGGVAAGDRARPAASRLYVASQYSSGALVALAALGAVIGVMAWLAFLTDGQTTEATPEPRPTPLVHPQTQLPPVEPGPNPPRIHE